MVHQSEVDEIPDFFFTKISHETIFKTIDRPESQRRLCLNKHSPGYPGTGRSPQNSVALTPSKNNQKESDKHNFAGRCKIKGCLMRSTEVCRACTDENEYSEHYICRRRCGIYW